jgi:hypothetical protein
MYNAAHALARCCPQFTSSSVSCMAITRPHPHSPSTWNDLPTGLCTSMMCDIPSSPPNPARTSRRRALFRPPNLALLHKTQPSSTRAAGGAVPISAGVWPVGSATTAVHRNAGGSRTATPSAASARRGTAQQQPTSRRLRHELASLLRRRGPSGPAPAPRRTARCEEYPPRSIGSAPGPRTTSPLSSFQSGQRCGRRRAATRGCEGGRDRRVGHGHRGMSV